MQTALKSFRLHIGIFGRRNVGKSSILNVLTRQQSSIVSDVPGTTTDPVEKPMELMPLGAVLFLDTAGIDDKGTLGSQRIAKTKQALERTDLALLVTDQGIWTNYEEELYQELSTRKIPTIIIFNKSDLKLPSETLLHQLKQKNSANDIPFVYITISTQTKNGLDELPQALLSIAPEAIITRPAIAADLVPEGHCAILVTPIDKEAPKGRLILPEVQTIRDLLDHNRITVICRETELSASLAKLKEKPAIVITDSQAFERVNALTPPDIPLTGFSILFARLQGDLNEMTCGAMAIETLKPGDRVLIAEACSHHPIQEDIGTVKIPRWLNKYVGGELNFQWTHGHDFPADLDQYKLVIHCGACMWNRRALLSRILHCKQIGVPITNYGLTIAYSLKIFDRALQPFPEAYQIYKSRK